MLDLNITLIFQLVNFFVAIYFLNILLIKPLRDIIKKRQGVLDEMSSQAGSFESQASEKLDKYEKTLLEARKDASKLRDDSRNAGIIEQQNIVGEAQKKARAILSDAQKEVEEQAASTLNTLQAKVSDYSEKLATRLMNA